MSETLPRRILSILAVAGDPGGAAALAPVVKALRDSGRYRVSACAYAQAQPLWLSSGIASQAPCALPELVAESDLVITATSVNPEKVELHALALARSLNVPSLALLDFWSNYRLRFTDNQGKWVLPDKIAVMDDLAREEMIGEGFAPDILTITGQPAFDRVSDAKRSFTPQHRQSLRNALDINEDGLLILFVSQPFADIYGSSEATRDTLGFDEHIVLSHCCKTLAKLSRSHSSPITLAIRPHPREAANKFPVIQEDLFRTVTWITPSQLEAALSADLVLGMNSVLLYEAALMGCPTVSVQPGLKVADPLPSNRSGTTTAVYDTGELEIALEKALYDKDHRRDTGLSSMNIPPTGNATAMVIMEIGKLIRSKQGRAHG